MIKTGSDNERTRRVGVIGLGAMGGGIARRLVSQGFAVVGHDVDAARNAAAAAGGVVIAPDAAAVARQASRVICLVDTGAQVLDVAAAIGGAMGAGDTFLCMSTVDQPVIDAAAAIIAQTGADYLDAPLSGGPAAAEAGTLVSILGGPAATVAACLPVIEAISRRHFHMGGIGAGFAAKMVNNLAFHIASVGVIEAMVVGTKAGIDPELLYDLLTNASGDSVALRTRVPRFLRRDFVGGPLTTAFREVVMETGLAARLNVPIPLGRLTEEVHRMGIAAGLGAEEGAALVKVYEDWAGVRVEARATDRD